MVLSLACDVVVVAAVSMVVSLAVVTLGRGIII